MTDLPFHDGQESAPTLTGAQGRKPGRNPNPRSRCAASQPSQSQPGQPRRVGRGAQHPRRPEDGATGVSWDVEVGTYARLQVKKLAGNNEARPRSPA